MKLSPKVNPKIITECLFAVVYLYFRPRAAQRIRSVDGASAKTKEEKARKGWLETYPHSIFASVLLLDNKIENWKVVNYPKRSPQDFSGFWKAHRLSDYTCQWKEFVVNNLDEHNKAFSELAPKWFSQWEHADDFRGCRAHTIPEPAAG